MATTSAPSSQIPEPTPAPVKKKGASRYVTPILALVAVLAVGVFGGVLIGHSTASTSATGTGTRGGFGGGTGGTEGGFGGGTGGTEGGTRTGTAGSFTSGKVTANSDGTLTITTTAGKTVKVTTGTDTSVTVTGKVSDVAKGDTVTVVGTTNSDGSITATRLSEGTTTGFGGGAGGGAAGTAPQG